jgi:hypothetical protein
VAKRSFSETFVLCISFKKMWNVAFSQHAIVQVSFLSASFRPSSVVGSACLGAAVYRKLDSMLTKHSPTQVLELPRVHKNTAQSESKLYMTYLQIFFETSGSIFVLRVKTKCEKYCSFNTYLVRAFLWLTAI